MRVYKSWLPVVSGVLSFGVCGKFNISPHESKSFVGKIDNELSLVSVIQSRTDTDVHMVERFFRSSLFGHYYFFEFEHSNKNQKFITGKIVRLEKSPQKFLKSSNYFKSFDSKKLVEECQIETARGENATDGKDESKNLSAKFTLWRRGDLELEFDDALLAQHLAIDNPDRMIEHDYARYFYYVLRDSFHQHSHHRIDEEDIIPICVSDRKNDEDWRISVLSSLIRCSVTKPKNGRSIEAIEAASGILLYAQSFHERSKEFISQSHYNGKNARFRISNQPKSSLDSWEWNYSFERRRESFRQQVEALKTKANSHIAFATFKFSILLGVFALLLAWGQTFVQRVDACVESLSCQYAAATNALFNFLTVYSDVFLGSALILLFIIPTRVYLTQERFFVEDRRLVYMPVHQFARIVFPKYVGAALTVLIGSFIVYYSIQLLVYFFQPA